jgi:hypothetical protein
MRLFISYAHEDIESAEWINNWLIKHGHATWFDKVILIGQEWETEITTKIKWSSGFVFLMSQHSLESEYCQKELSIALEQNKSIFPIRLDNTPLEQTNLNPIQTADFSHHTSIDDEKARLLRSIWSEQVNVFASKSAKYIFGTILVFIALVGGLLYSLYEGTNTQNRNTAIELANQSLQYARSYPSHGVLTAIRSLKTHHTPQGYQALTIAIDALLDEREADTSNVSFATAFFSSDGTLLVGSNSDEISLIDVNTREHIWTLPNSIGVISHVSFSADKSFVAISTDNQRVEILETLTGSVVSTITVFNSGIEATAFSTDNSTLGVLSFDNGEPIGEHLSLWNFRDASTIAVSEPTFLRGERSLTYLPSQDTWLITRALNALEVWKLQDDQLFQINTTGTIPEGFGVLSASQRRLATISQLQEYRVWEGTTWKEVCHATAPYFLHPYDLVMSYDGGRIAIASIIDGPIQIRNTSDCSLTHIVEGEFSDTIAVSFNADNSIFYTFAGTGTIRYWHTRYEEMIVRACGLLPNILEDLSQFGINEDLSICFPN